MKKEKGETQPEAIKVLLVDDSEATRDELLTLFKFEKDIKVVGVAEDGFQALKKTQELLPDVVLMDVKMEGMDGLEATRHLKKREPSLGIILLSLYDNDQWVLEGIKAGAATYVLKGVPFTKLTATIREVHQGKSLPFKIS